MNKSLLSLFILSSLLVGCGQETVSTEPLAPVVRPVKLFTLADVQAANIREFPAQVRAHQEVLMSFRVGGELEQLNVIAAQRVKQGELLAMLDQRDYQTEVALRKTDYELSTTNFERIAQLRQQRMVSQADYDNAKANVDATKAALTLAEDRLSDTRLLAPYAGRIAQVAVENYEFIQPQQAIVLLQADDKLEISIQFPEHLLKQINKHQLNLQYQPQVRFSGSDTSYPIVYQEHSTLVTPGTQTYEVIFVMEMPSSGQTLYPGMSASVTIDMGQVVTLDTQGEQTQSEFLVPVTAVLTDDKTGQAQVWRYQQGQVEPIAVELQQVTDQGIWVKGALNANDQLVSAGLNRLQPGMEVKPLARERGL